GAAEDQLAASCCWPSMRWMDGSSIVVRSPTGARRDAWSPGERCQTGTVRSPLTEQVHESSASPISATPSTNGTSVRLSSRVSVADGPTGTPSAMASASGTAERVAYGFGAGRFRGPDQAFTRGGVASTQWPLQARQN